MKTKVLVVDDDPEARIIMSDFLSQLNIQHTLVSSAAECLAKLVNDPNEFSMVLMDIHMPSLSGVDASTWIQGSDIDPPRNIPIIAMTADESFHDRENLARIGMCGALAKPVSLETLRATLSKLTVYH